MSASGSAAASIAKQVGSVNLLVLVQLAAVGMPLLWLVWASFHQWSFSDPVGSFSLSSFERLSVSGPARSAFLHTAGLTCIAAFLSLAVALPVAISVRSKGEGGLSALLFLAVPAFAATPVRGEAWRSLSVLLGLGSPTWTAVPSMVAAAVPFTAWVAFLGMRSLSPEDLTLARALGIRRSTSVIRLWGRVLVSSLGAAWLFAGLVISFDQSTASELYRGSAYLLDDELRGRLAVQAWSNLAADAAVMAAIAGLAVTAAAIAWRPVVLAHGQELEGVRRRSSVPAWALLPAFCVVLAPAVALAIDSFSSSELSLSLLGGGTVRWWGEAIASTRIAAATSNSVADCVVAVGLGVPVGLGAAYQAWRKAARGSTVAGEYALWFLPWLVPPTALGIAVSLLLRALQVPLSLVPTAFYHALYVGPLTAALCLAQMRQIPEGDIALGRALGISGSRTLVTLLLPRLLFPLAMAGIAGVAIVWSEVSLAELLSGLDETLPVLLRGLARSGGTPVIAVVGTTGIGLGLMLLMVILSSTRSGAGRTAA